jgi:hypothetical protein
MEMAKPLKTLKRFFGLKIKYSLNLKIKYQQFTVKGRSQD